MNDQDKLKDHKQIGQELELFFTHEIAPGAPFWLPKGMVIFKELEKFIRELTANAGYQETSTPIMVKNELFKQSGHWTKFGEHNMYNLPIYEDEESDQMIKDLEEAEKEGKVIKVASNTFQPVANYTLKPMNCPESTILYRFKPRSYKELPLRLAEIGRLHRREKSGEVNGLLRVRQITMDDAHIYAREDQIMDEVSTILDMMIEFYKNFKFEYEFRLATRPEEYAGTEENWIRAEKALQEALEKKGISYTIKEKDGAFYGPKIDMHIKDALTRDWQLATVQIDFHQPQAFDLKYINEKSENDRPVMIHRAIFGSFERFIGILTEHFQGSFPTWLSPTQVMIVPISDKNNEYAQKVLEQLKNADIRAEIDTRAETMQAKIRDAQLQKIPYMLVVGAKEEAGQTVAVRSRSGENEQSSSQNKGVVPVDEFITKISSEIESKSLISKI